MTSIVLVAHGRLAVEMKASCEMIYGPCPQLSCVTFPPQEGFDTVKEKISMLVSKKHGDALILTDLFGGTPFNAACAVAMERGNACVEVISGMSLPLILEAASYSNEEDAGQLAQRILDRSSQAVRRFEPEVVDEDNDL